MRSRGGAWRRGRDNDAFFREARRRGLRSRAALKLEAIDARDRLFRGVRMVVDLGAAPGGWSQIARRALPHDGRIVALDIAEMEPLAGVEFIQGDFRRPEVLDRLVASVGGRAVDLVMSDMAPNLSGARVNDQVRWRELAESAAKLAGGLLKSDGVFLVKLFHGEETEPYLGTLRERFASVTVRKPAASRKHSSETYALARRMKGADGKNRTRGRARPSMHRELSAGKIRWSTVPDGGQRVEQRPRRTRSGSRGQSGIGRQSSGTGQETGEVNRPDSMRTVGV